MKGQLTISASLFSSWFSSWFTFFSSWAFLASTLLIVSSNFISISCCHLPVVTAAEEQVAQHKMTNQNTTEKRAILKLFSLRSDCDLLTNECIAIIQLYFINLPTCPVRIIFKKRSLAVTRDNNQHDFDFPGCFATVYVNDGQTLYDNLIGLLHTAPTFKIWVSDER